MNFLNLLPLELNFGEPAQLVYSIIQLALIFLYAETNFHLEFQSFSVISESRRLQY